MDPDSPSTASQLAIHELRHDLASAQSLVEQILADLSPDASARRPARSLQDLLTRTKGSLEGILLADADTAQRRPTHVADLIARVVDAHEHHEHRITTEVASLVINIDPVKLERIVDNLLTNALQHAPAGTEIRLTCQAAQRGGLLLTVEHDGDPVPPHVRERLRDYQPSEARPPTGLEIVARFAHAHGGALHIDDQRASVQVQLPRSSHRHPNRPAH